LKAGLWFRRGRLVMVSPVSGIYAKVRQKFHLSPLFKFPEPALHAVSQLAFIRAVVPLCAGDALLLVGNDIHRGKTITCFRSPAVSFAPTRRRTIRKFRATWRGSHRANPTELNFVLHFLPHAC